MSSVDHTRDAVDLIATVVRRQHRWKMRHLGMSVHRNPIVRTNSSSDCGYLGQCIADCPVGSFRSEADALYRDQLNVVEVGGMCLQAAAGITKLCAGSASGSFSAAGRKLRRA
jgi:hypothetical protein